jgi:uncharacterized membrane-anchored protein YitT (DUF2179 family)
MQAISKYTQLQQKMIINVFSYVHICQCTLWLANIDPRSLIIFVEAHKVMLHAKYLSSRHWNFIQLDLNEFINIKVFEN